MPEKYSFSHGTACGDNGFIVAGGIEDSGVVTNAIFKYSASSDTWTTLPSFKHPRYAHSSVCFKDFIYVIGGWKALWQSTHSVEKFDFASQRLADVQPIPEDLRSPSAVVANERLFVYAGSSLYMLDEDESKWIPRARGPACSSYDKPAVLDDKIYVVHDSDAFRYYPLTDEWTTLRSTTLSRYDSVCVALNSKILVLYGSHYDCKEIEEYDEDDCFFRLTLDVNQSWHV
jgi:hypothetical protein